MKTSFNHGRIDHGPALPVTVALEGLVLNGDLCIPAKAGGLAVFAHGSGSGRHSPRNRYVAEALNGREIGTLLIDLLTEHEEQIDRLTRHLRFDIPMLAKRLTAIGDWVMEQSSLRDLKLGYFGASTGAAAALIAASRQPEKVAAVVSRGGRPDLAMNYLPRVKAPVLLIVGERDPEVLELNKQALERLNSQSRLIIIPRAMHLFEEPGALEEVAASAAEWFSTHFGA